MGIRNVYLQGTCTDKREPTMCQMGAILGCGLIDAAGRNVTISLFDSHNNCKRQSAIIGMAMFWQYWFWYPLIPFITLCFQPTMIMNLNKELKMVKINVESREKDKARFDYVENLKEDTKKKQKKQIKVSLSVAAKTKQRKSKQSKIEKENKENGKEENDVEMKGNDDDEKKKNEEEKTKEVESEFNLLSNPSRVTPNQIKYVQWIDKRYKPLTLRLSGFVMVEDTKPEMDEEFVEQKEIGTGGVYGDEPDPPKPFKYMGN